MEKERKILRNRAKCLNCGEIIESKSTHDYQTCSCGSLAVDGGLDYIRRTYLKEGCYEDMNEYQD